MKFGATACERFSRLLSEGRDRNLNPREENFMESHVGSCADCADSARADRAALLVLAGYQFEIDVDSSFDGRIVRMATVSTRKESLKYWSPAIIGGAIACLALTASLQLLTRSTEPHVLNSNGNEAKRTAHSNLVAPLNLDRIPVIR